MFFSLKNPDVDPNAGSQKKLGSGSGCNQYSTALVIKRGIARLLFISDRTLRFWHCRFLRLGTLFLCIVQEEKICENCSSLSVVVPRRLYFPALQ
jgi:hypothetical protein